MSAEWDAEPRMWQVFDFGNGSQTFVPRDTREAGRDALRETCYAGCDVSKYPWLGDWSGSRTSLTERLLAGARFDPAGQCLAERDS